MKSRIPMSPEQMPQQRIYLVQDLPPRPEGFFTKCRYGISQIPGADRPLDKPASARFVCTLEWAWSPMHSRISAYHLSMNRQRSHWLLWVSLPDDDNWDGQGRWTHDLVAFGPKRGVPPGVAATWLLHDMLAMEAEEGEEYLDFMIDDTGLLDVEEIRAIQRALES